MPRLLILFSSLFLAAACSLTNPVLAPRRPPTEEHLAARANDECRGCHDISKKSNHKSTDNCLGCHRLSPGR